MWIFVKTVTLGESADLEYRNGPSEVSVSRQPVVSCLDFIGGASSSTILEGPEAGWHMLLIFTGLPRAFKVIKTHISHSSTPWRFSLKKQHAVVVDFLPDIKKWILIFSGWGRTIFKDQFSLMGVQYLHIQCFVDFPFPQCPSFALGPNCLKAGL